MVQNNPAIQAEQLKYDPLLVKILNLGIRSQYIKGKPVAVSVDPKLNQDEDAFYSTLKLYAKVWNIDAAFSQKDPAKITSLKFKPKAEQTIDDALVAITPEKAEELFPWESLEVDAHYNMIGGKLHFARLNELREIKYNVTGKSERVISALKRKLDANYENVLRGKVPGDTNEYIVITGNLRAKINKIIAPVYQRLFENGEQVDPEIDEALAGLEEETGEVDQGTQGAETGTDGQSQS